MKKTKTTTIATLQGCATPKLLKNQTWNGVPNFINLIHRGLSNNIKNVLQFQYNFQFQFYLVFIDK
jgi:hypothetical protein